MKFGHTFELLSGHKTETSRIPAMKWYDEWNYKDVSINHRPCTAEGPNGETLPLMLKFCTVRKIGYQRDVRFWQEGFCSPKAFEDIWRQLYNRFNPDELACVIEFDVLTAKVIYK